MAELLPSPPTQPEGAKDHPAGTKDEVQRHVRPEAYGVTVSMRSPAAHAMETLVNGMSGGVQKHYADAEHHDRIEERRLRHE
jgi:hypothetical protein